MGPSRFLGESLFEVHFSFSSSLQGGGSRSSRDFFSQSNLEWPGIAAKGMRCEGSWAEGTHTPQPSMMSCVLLCVAFKCVLHDGIHNVVWSGSIHEMTQHVCQCWDGLSMLVMSYHSGPMFRLQSTEDRPGPFLFALTLHPLVEESDDTLRRVANSAAQVRAREVLTGPKLLSSPVPLADFFVALSLLYLSTPPAPDPTTWSSWYPRNLLSVENVLKTDCQWSKYAPNQNV